MKKFVFILFSLALGAILFSNIQCGNNTAKSESVSYLNHNDTVKYIGKEQCRACHASIYNSFIETGMGKSFNVASKAKSAADFSKKHVVYDKFKDFYYIPYWQQDSFYIMEFRLQGKDTIHKRIERVDYIIGSGQHTNSHFTNINGYVYQLPLTWYAQKGKWDLPPGFENGRNVRFTRAIEFECMSCHNAMPTVADNSINKFTSIPNGIDCERCHGPGELHLKEKLAGHIVDTAHAIDYTIVNPKKLPWERQIDLCQRCHLQGNAILKKGKSFKDFRPGMVLSDFYDVFMPRYKGDDETFIMASHAQRLQLSKCFIESSINSSGKAVGLTCINCHNPHVSVKVTGKEIFNNACLKCHQSADACKEKASLKMTNNNNCVACHMPKSGTIDIPHVTVHDHWIRKPTKQKDIESVNLTSTNYDVLE
jgi:predicted CXXCH cytochrome family protein